MREPPDRTRRAAQHISGLMGGQAEEVAQHDRFALLPRELLECLGDSETISHVTITMQLLARTVPLVRTALCRASPEPRVPEVHPDAVGPPHRRLKAADGLPTVARTDQRVLRQVLCKRRVAEVMSERLRR